MIKDIRIVPLEDSPYVRPKTMLYTYKGKPRRWDLVEVHDSVAILLADPLKEYFILVKQFRPSVYLHNQDGFTYELCAGIVDKKSSVEQIAKEEVLEECGYDIPLEQMERVTSFFSSVGFGASTQTLFYAEVSESLRVSEGGGIDVEDIEVVYLPFSEAKHFIYDESIAKTPGVLFAIEWYFTHKSVS